MTAPALVAGALCGAALLILPVRRRLRLVPATTGRGGPSRTARRARREGPASAGEPTAGDVLALVELVATQVRAGASPLGAWHAAVDVLELRTAGAAPLDWLDVVARDAERTRAGAAAAAAAAWRLAERTGAPLADVLDGVAAAVRDELAVAGEIEVALAGPRATVRLLSALPLAGLLLGQLIGARPLSVLSGTTAGRTCAVVGAALLLVGRRWMRHLVARVAAR